MFNLGWDGTGFLEDEIPLNYEVGMNEGMFSRKQ